MKSATQILPSRDLPSNGSPDCEVNIKSGTCPNTGRGARRTHPVSKKQTRIKEAFNAESETRPVEKHEAIEQGEINYRYQQNAARTQDAEVGGRADTGIQKPTSEQQGTQQIQFTGHSEQ